MMARVWNSAMPTSTHKLVLLAFADCANEDGICWPSIRRVAIKSQISERQVQRIVGDLKSTGLLVTIRSAAGRRTPTYQISGDMMTPLRCDGEPSVAPRVTNGVAEGDAHDAPEVTPTSPKSSENRHKESSILAAAADGTMSSEIFTLYEQHIGTISPFIAAMLADAEREYPADCMRHAFEEASRQNVRRWAYVEAILERHRREGCFVTGRSSRSRRGAGGASAGYPFHEDLIESWRPLAELTETRLGREPVRRVPLAEEGREGRSAKG